MERLQKYMAHAGIASRRKSEDIISKGRVKVNGKTVIEIGIKINPEVDIVEVDGQVINREDKIYLILNKPTGYVTTVSDPRGRKTVMDLIENVAKRIYPVGRLDYDSSGLLLMTNDGELTYILTHPSYEINKTYRVKVPGMANKNKLKLLEKGVMLKDGITAPAKIKNIKYNKDNTVFNITIHEGKNREIRRMCKKIGYNVMSLKRIALFNLKLGDLQTGSYRYLNREELSNLRKVKLKEKRN